MSTLNIEKNELLELEILNHVEYSPKQTTRLLASHIGCNLRLTHALLKKLIRQGLLDVKKINSRNWHYYLTPKGIADKASKTYKVFEFSMQFYQQARGLSSSLCRRLSENGIKDIAFFGSGNLAEITYLASKENNLNLIEVYGDSRNDFLGHTVLPFEQIEASKADFMIICIYEKKHSILQLLKKVNTNNVEWIFK